MKEKLIQHLPKNAAVVIDNAPYHIGQLNKPPNASQNKMTVVVGHKERKISFSLNIRKIELLELVKSNSLHIKTYKFYTMLAELGHYALRLPHCDISAIEYVCADMTDFIYRQNITVAINMKYLF